MVWIIVSLLSLKNPDHQQGYVGDESFLTQGKCQKTLEKKFGKRAKEYRCVPSTQD